MSQTGYQLPGSTPCKGDHVDKAQVAQILCSQPARELTQVRELWAGVGEHSELVPGGNPFLKHNSAELPEFGPLLPLQKR